MNGTGVHIAGDRLLAVRLTADGPGGVADVVVAGPGRADLVAACIGAAATVGAATTEPLRLAWSAAHVELADVTAARPADLATTLRRFADAGCAAVTSESFDRRTVAVGIAWDHDTAQAVVADVRAAGFVDVVIEPAALSTWRVGERPMSEAGAHPSHVAAFGAALAAAGRAGRTGPVRRLDLAAAPSPATTTWVLERVSPEPAAAVTRRGPLMRLSAVVGRVRSARCAS